MKETRLMRPNTVGELHGHVHYERLSCASEPACVPIDPFQDAVPCFQDRHPLRKTATVWHLFVNYGQGWEDEIEEDSWKEMRNRLREYRENCPQYPVKTVKRLEVKKQYEIVR